MFIMQQRKNRAEITFSARDSFSHLQLFKVGKIMLSKHRHLMLPSGTFPDKVTPGIDFTDEAVVQCDVPVVKILL